IIPVEAVRARDRAARPAEHGERIRIDRVHTHRAVELHRDRRRSGRGDGVGHRVDAGDLHITWIVCAQRDETDHHHDTEDTCSESNTFHALLPPFEFEPVLICYPTERVKDGLVLVDALTLPQNAWILNSDNLRLCGSKRSTLSWMEFGVFAPSW